MQEILEDYKQLRLTVENPVIIAVVHGKICFIRKTMYCFANFPTDPTTKRYKWKGVNHVLFSDNVEVITSKDELIFAKMKHESVPAFDQYFKVLREGGVLLGDFNQDR